MKYKDFLTEQPKLDKISSKPSKVDALYDIVSEKSEPIKSYKIDRYDIEEYDYDRSHHIFVLSKEKHWMGVDVKVRLYIDHVHEVNKTLGNCFRNAMIAKGVSGINQFSVIDILFEILNRYDAFVSDKVQSFGGKSMWKRMLKQAHEDNKTIGVYDNSKDEIIDTLGKDESFDAWYEKISSEYYSDKDEHEKYQLFIKK